MDRRQRKLEAKRKKRDLAKKRARAAEAARPSELERAIRAASRSPFGPCGVSNGWDDEEEHPRIISVLVTRSLPSGELLPALALVDRTCLGIKEAMTMKSVAATEVTDLFRLVGTPHGGMTACEPAVAQSIVFHALDYSRRLGFAPNPDFREELWLPRPEELIATPWRARERPLYVPGPYDDIDATLLQLCRSVGDGNFDLLADFEDDDEDDFEDEDLDEARGA